MTVAAILGDASVVTWDHSVNGTTFAAILGDASVVTWGHFVMVATAVLCKIS